MKRDQADQDEDQAQTDLLNFFNQELELNDSVKKNVNKDLLKEVDRLLNLRNSITQEKLRISKLLENDDLAQDKYDLLFQKCQEKTAQEEKLLYQLYDKLVEKKPSNFANSIYTSQFVQPKRVSDLELMEQNIKNLNQGAGAKDLTYQEYEELMEQQEKQQEHIKNQKICEEFRQIPVPAEQKFESLIVKKTKLFQEKRFLSKFIFNLLQNDVLTLENLNKAFSELQDERERQFKMIGDFMHLFKAEKQYFNEKTFNLFELANTIHQQKLSNDAVEQVAKYIKKIKKFFNLSENLDPEEDIDPHQQMPVELFSHTFDILCNKALFENGQIGGFIQNAEKLVAEKTQQLQPTNVKNLAIFEQNIIGDYANKFFKQLDENLFHTLSQISDISKFLMDQNNDDETTMYREDKVVFDDKTGIHYQKSLPVAKILWYILYMMGEVSEPWETYQKSRTLNKFIVKDNNNLYQTQNIGQLQQDESQYKTKVTKEDDQLLNLLNTKKSTQQQQQPQQSSSSQFFENTQISSAFNKATEQQQLNSKNKFEDLKNEPLAISQAYDTLGSFKKTKNNFMQDQDNFNATGQDNLQNLENQDKKLLTQNMSKDFLSISQAFETDGFKRKPDRKIQSQYLGLGMSQVIQKDPLALHESSFNKENSLNYSYSQALLNIKNDQMTQIENQSSVPLSQQIMRRTTNLKDTIDYGYVKPKGVELGKYNITSDKFNDYQVFLPNEYYNFLATKKQQQKNAKDGWFHRTHHIETVTEHPFSAKDNLLDTKYESYVSPIDQQSLRKKEEAKNPHSKEKIINNLEDKLKELKTELDFKKAKSLASKYEPRKQKQIEAPDTLQYMQGYYNQLEQTQKKDLLYSTYDSFLNELRSQEKSMLNKKRDDYIKKYGPPEEKWWEEKRDNFSDEFAKYKRLDGPQGSKHRQLIDKLAIKELY